MKKHSVPVSYLVFPILLPFAQCRFLKQTVSLNDQLWCGSLKTDTAFNADDCITDVTVTSDTVGGANLFYLLDGFDLIIKLLSVDRDNLALFKFYLQQTLILFGYMF